jgi:hypothetical protein
MKEAKGRTETTPAKNGASGDSNAVASSSDPSTSLNIQEGDADGDTDADVSASVNSPVKTEPHDVEVADMLLVPETETETATPVPEDVQMDADVTPTADANMISAAVLGQDIIMAGDGNEPTAPEVVPPPSGDAQVDAPTEAVTALMDYNPAMTNAEGEPLMAMMTDEAVADIPITAPLTIATAPGESRGNQPPSPSQPGDAVPEITPEVAAIVAGASSGRHRHGDSSATQARLKLLREKPEVVSRFLFLVVPILFDVFSASVTLQVRMRCFLGILKATSFVDGPGMELLYKVNFPVEATCNLSLMKPVERPCRQLYWVHSNIQG